MRAAIFQTMALISLAAPTSARAQTPNDGNATFEAFLREAFRNRNPLDAIASVLPGPGVEYALGPREPGGYMIKTAINADLVKPAKKLERYCIDNQGRFEPVLLAFTRGFPERTTATVPFAAGQIEVSYEMLWMWEQGETLGVPFPDADRYGSLAPSPKARAVFETTPPFGLFGCSGKNGEVSWVASVMPMRIFDGWMAVGIRQVTWSMVHKATLRRNEVAAAKAANVRRAEERFELDRRLAAQREAAERTRLEPFRAGLKIGSQTSCGLFIDVRGPIVEVQLPANMIGPNGETRFWLPRDTLTDAPPAARCTYGR
jgi:hypothetical protein